MKPYTIHIDIGLPRQQVVELFENQENLFAWQTGLEDVQHVSGILGREGAQSLLVFNHGSQSIELKETLTHVDLPELIEGLYEWDGGQNTLSNRFVELGSDSTRLQCVCHYQFSKLAMKLMGFLMPGTFKKQHMKFLQNFKAFCESGQSVTDFVQRKK